MKLKLNGNGLKLIALITMTIDHAGLILFPQYPVLRIIGRLSFPIFAWMIAEGCRYTRNRKKYLAMLLGLAAVCQLAYFFAMQSYYMNILITFSLSAVLIFTLENCTKRTLPWSAGILFLLAAAFLCEGLPRLLCESDFQIDYGFFGVILPGAVYFAKDKISKLAAAGVCLCLLALAMGTIQWFGLFSIPLLALYDGTRGKKNLKYLFYIYYPLHLLVIEGIAMLLGY